MQHPPKLMVLSIDGVPHGLLCELMAAGVLPAFSRFCEQHGSPRMMRSVLPTVSNVAWASFTTGRNPGKHGIYGFIDREVGSYDLMFPTATNLRGRNIWEILSQAGKKVFGMNVPSTYPPRAVNGIMIGGFLGPSLDKIAYPPEVGGYLRSIDYRIDSDAALARKSKEKMFANLEMTLQKRSEAMFHFLQEDQWDYFHVHVMGTDRINHFLLDSYYQGDKRFAPGFVEYYRKVDSVFDQLLDAIGDEAPLMILSDHGFCPIRYEVQLSRYLVETGWTVPAEQVTGPLSFDPKRTRAFTLIPGRIYVNLCGREAAGCVEPDQYEQVRSEVSADLLKLRDPQGLPVIRTVLKREEIYWPTGAAGPDSAHKGLDNLPPYSLGPDLVAIPHDGYDLKLGLGSAEIFVKTQLEGMHTYHDAMLLGRNVSVPDGDIEIRQLSGSILNTLGVEPAEDMDLAAVPTPAGMV